MLTINTIDNSGVSTDVHVLRELSGSLFLYERNIYTMLVKPEAKNGDDIEKALWLLRLQRCGTWAEVPVDAYYSLKLLTYMLPIGAFNKDAEFAIGDEVRAVVIYDSPDNDGNGPGTYTADWDGDLSNQGPLYTYPVSEGPELNIYETPFIVKKKLKNEIYLVFNKTGYFPIPGALLCPSLTLIPYLT